jgi:hypothetical protein
LGEGKDIVQRSPFTRLLAFAVTFAMVVTVATSDGASANTCSAPVQPRDLGGGNLVDQQYVIEVPLSYLPPSYTMYYKGGEMTLAFHGIHKDKLRWGVPTGWAYLNYPGWLEPGNWNFYFRCEPGLA